MQDTRRAMPTQDPSDPILPLAERRHARRTHVIQRVRIVAGNRQIEAVMLDISDTGLQLQLLAAVELPPTFVLRFHDGSARKVEQRWHFGLKVGVEFLADVLEEPSMPAPTGGLSEVRSWLEKLRAVELAGLLHLLAHEEYFGSQEIQAAARDFDLSFQRLRQAIQHRLQG